MFAEFPDELINPTTEEKLVNLVEVRNLSWKGFDGDTPERRLFAWLVETNVYPRMTNEWGTKLGYYKQTYNHCIKIFGLQDWLNFKEPDSQAFRDFGLSDNNSMYAVHIDVIRTGRQIFFLKPDPIEGDTCQGEEDILVNFRKHIRRMERIIYIFVQF